jgi:hypothetical protein
MNSLVILLDFSLINWISLVDLLIGVDRNVFQLILFLSIKHICLVFLITCFMSDCVVEVVVYV